MDSLSSPETHNARLQALEVVQTPIQPSRTRQPSHDRHDLQVNGHTFDSVLTTEASLKKMKDHVRLLSLFSLGLVLRSRRTRITASSIAFSTNTVSVSYTHLTLPTKRIV